VLQKSKIERRQKSREGRILDAYIHCKAPLRRYEGPWSFLRETMRSLTSQRAKRISGPKNLVRQAKKTFSTLSALFGSAAMSDPSPECAPRRTFVHHSGFMTG
jgi:hypothetical protein